MRDIRSMMNVAWGSLRKGQNGGQNGEAESRRVSNG
jgi:hypothetical protein